MYQMMQLPDHALAQYEELEALLTSSSLTIASHLPASDWPMVSSDPPPSSTDPLPAVTSSADKSSSGREKDCCSDASKNGEEVISYSINSARMKVSYDDSTFISLILTFTLFPDPEEPDGIAGASQICVRQTNVLPRTGIIFLLSLFSCDV